MGARDVLRIADCDAYIDPSYSKLVTGIREIGLEYGNENWLNNHIDIISHFNSDAPSFQDLKPYLSKVFDFYKSYKNIELHIAKFDLCCT